VKIQFIVTEQDSDNDIVKVYGNFPSIEAAMRWLKNTHVPGWVGEYESYSGYKTNVNFYSGRLPGAADGTTCTHWQVLPVTLIEES
jgi:hypothetical protein